MYYDIFLRFWIYNVGMHRLEFSWPIPIPDFFVSEIPIFTVPIFSPDN